MKAKKVQIILLIVVAAGILSLLLVYQPWKKEDSSESLDMGQQTLENQQSEVSVAGLTSNPNPNLDVNADGLSEATVLIRTEKGDIKYKFFAKDAPETTRRMVELIQQGFYNGLIFHRVEPGFVIQGGDPLGNGTGGSGQKLKAEFNQRPHLEGTVAMARANDPNSADSQFYITLGPQPFLDGKYTVFGQLVEGMDVVRSIRPGDKMLAVIVE